MRYSTPLIPARRLASESSRSPALQRTFKYARYTGYLGVSSVLGVFVLGTAIFIHDAFTYSEKHVERVPISPLALHPELGGPKNLPIVRVQVDDEDDEENRALAKKPRLVVVGGGWGVRPSSIALHSHVKWFLRLWECSKPSIPAITTSPSFQLKHLQPLHLFFLVTYHSPIQ